MSNYWDLGCIDCGEQAGIHANNSENQILNVIAVAPALAELGKTCPEMFIDTRDFGVNAETGGKVPAGWFTKHAGHQLSPKSEYGYYMKNCSVRVLCSECGKCGFFVVNAATLDSA
jgi:hypothetical protein